jgi:heme A synthase
MLDSTILIHRSSSIAIFLLLAWLFWRNWRNEYAVHSVGMAFLFVVLEVLVGASLYYFHIPNWLQPIHLMLSTGTFALLVWALFRTKKLQV